MASRHCHWRKAKGPLRFSKRLDCERSSPTRLCLPSAPSPAQATHWSQRRPSGLWTIRSPSRSRCKERNLSWVTTIGWWPVRSGLVGWSRSSGPTPTYEDDLMRVAQYVTLTVGAFPLYEELRRLFNGDYPPTALHRFLAELPSILREHRAEAPPYQLIVTTNYDDVLEQAFRDADEPFDLVIYDAEGPDRGKFTHHPHDGTPRTILEPNAYYDLTTDERTVILKLGGSVDRDDETRDSFVITEDHYIDYLARTDVSKLFPVTLVRTLRRSHCLFVGYSLQESNQRVILNRIWGEEKLRSKSWAIQRNPDPVDEGLWSRRDVQSLDVPLEDYIDGLREALRAEKPSGR